MKARLKLVFAITIFFFLFLNCGKSISLMVPDVKPSVHPMVKGTVRICVTDIICEGKSSNDGYWTFLGPIVVAYENWHKDIGARVNTYSSFVVENERLKEVLTFAVKKIGIFDKLAENESDFDLLAQILVQETIDFKNFEARAFLTVRYKLTHNQTKRSVWQETYNSVCGYKVGISRLSEARDGCVGESIGSFLDGIISRPPKLDL